MNTCGYLNTGQTRCYDTSGREVPCSGSGQDAEFKKGISWPAPRFEQKNETVSDNLTGLMWTRSANLAEFPVTWQEALDYIAEMNHKEVFGYADWRLPNRRELRSLISHQTRKPALPDNHHFYNVFSGWYWTSTTAAINTAYAWYIHTEGARMFYGNKRQFYLLWPVRGEGYNILPVTGQIRCYNNDGKIISCAGSGQDGEFRYGHSWPQPRFESFRDTVIDRLTGLCWMRKADLTGLKVTWSNALKAVEDFNRNSDGRYVWRLPGINELESLVDCDTHSPALPVEHPFGEVKDAYWSSTTSAFEPDWAWALYLTKGAVGVGQKKGAHFFAWAVCDASDY
ncbi:hypothetical protein BMS3Bbin08_00039 [bacterium BMS3Bbin08]|nr:hypothetical protein BMS3Bbin08_00039 [bacterium BMS3Bbin08]